MAEEKPIRGHRRFNLALPLWVRFREGLKGKSASKSKATESVVEEEEETITTNISSGGCFFYMSRKPEVGTPATMVVDIPAQVSGRGGKVLCRGNVVWVSEGEKQGKVGVACTIDSYRFKPPTKD